IIFHTLAECIEVIEDFIRKNIKSIATLGIEHSTPYYLLQLLEKEAPGLSLELVNDMLVQLRIVKTPAEIAHAKKGTEIVTKTMGELFDLMYLGMSRLELMEEARYRMFRHGATGISHLTMAFGATNPEIALHEELVKDKLVTLDLGAFVDGYASDNRRYIYTGKVPSQVTETHEIMVETVDKVGAALVPGKRFCDIFNLAKELSAAQNIELAYSHVGHSMGLETEEMRIDGKEETEIQPGMVLNIEFFTKIPSGESLGNEETYVIGPEGSTRITLLPRPIRTLA
ncbi:MAG: aminopeptidase P family protein, partial [Anaerolineales bacterium]|nr:aminopeptidase P family protein [Anaerolineales bacterium]